MSLDAATHSFTRSWVKPDLAFLPVCSLDFPFAEGFGPDIKLMRTQTIMQGASHCDFRYKRQEADGRFWVMTALPSVAFRLQRICNRT